VAPPPSVPFAEAPLDHVLSLRVDNEADFLQLDAATLASNSAATVPLRTNGPLRNMRLSSTCGTICIARYIGLRAPQPSITKYNRRLRLKF
jgi:hypothetical protein